MLIKYISEILKKKELVIIPDFGAIFKNQMSAVVDSQNNILKPPFISYTFNEFLKYNDGEIANLIKEADGISKEEAEIKLTSFVQELKDKINNGKSICIERVGEFTIGANGKIILKAFDLKEKDENFGLPEISVEPINKAESIEPPVSAPVVEEIEITPIIEEPIVVEEIKVEEPKEIKIEEPNAEEVKTEEPIIKEEIPTASSHWSEKEEPAVNTVPTDNVEPIISETTEEKELVNDEIEEQPIIKKKRTGLVIFLSLIVLIICLVAGGLIFAPAKFKEMTKGLPFIGHANDTIITRDTVIKKDTIAEAPVVEEQTQDTTSVEPAPVEVKTEPAPKKQEQKATIVSGNYYIVAGSFSVAVNAEKLSNQLQGKGYSAQVIDYKGRSTVVYGSYATQSEVNTALAKIKSEENKDAWVLKK